MFTDGTVSRGGQIWCGGVLGKHSLCQCQGSQTWLVMINLTNWRAKGLDPQWWGCKKLEVYLYIRTRQEVCGLTIGYILINVLVMNWKESEEPFMSDHRIEKFSIDGKSELRRIVRNPRKGDIKHLNNNIWYQDRTRYSETGTYLERVEKLENSSIGRRKSRIG